MLPKEDRVASALTDEKSHRGPWGVADTKGWTTSSIRDPFPSWI